MSNFWLGLWFVVIGVYALFAYARLSIQAIEYEEEQTNSMLNKILKHVKIKCSRHFFALMIMVRHAPQQWFCLIFFITHPF